MNNETWNEFVKLLQPMLKLCESGEGGGGIQTSSLLASSQDWYIRPSILVNSPIFSACKKIKLHSCCSCSLLIVFEETVEVFNQYGIAIIKKSPNLD